MSVQKKPENTQRAEARETDTRAELEKKIVSLRTQLQRTASVAQRVALQEQLNAAERQLENLQ